MPNLFPAHVDGDTLPASDWNDAFDLVEASLLDVGPWIISGVTPSIGTGLSVNVTLGVIVIGGEISIAAMAIGGLTPSTTNHLYILQDGSGTANTSGTAPASSVKLGTCVTNGSAVSSVNVLRSSGRQTFVRPENQVPGAVGSPGSINLASWAAGAADAVPVYGTLPAGALGSAALSALTDVTVAGVAQGDVLYRGSSKWNNLAAGTSGQFLKTQGASANPTWATLALSNLTGDVTLSGVAQGDLLYRGASVWNNLATGAAGTLLQAGGSGANPSWVTNITPNNINMTGVMQGSTAGAGTAFRWASVTVTPPSDADYTLTAAEMSCVILSLATGSWTATHNIIVPAAVGGVWHFSNSSGFVATIKPSGGTGIAIANGRAAWIRSNGVNCRRVTADVDPNT